MRICRLAADAVTSANAGREHGAKLSTALSSQTIIRWPIRGPNVGPTIDGIMRKGLIRVREEAANDGSGLAIVPFLHDGLVDEYGWLTEAQFVDAVAIGLITPGPVVIMATFAGYLVHGVLGAMIATAAVFVPVYLFVVVPGRYFRRYENHPRLKGFVKGITAAAAGAIAGAAIVIARQTISGAISVLIGLIALGLLLQRRVKIPEPSLVAVAALAGLALHDG